jgi:rare lipoprotein A
MSDANSVSMPRAVLAWTFVLLLPLFTAACETKMASDQGRLPDGDGGVYKVGKPYQVAGVWYYPKEDENYDATGIASWYGPQFHGKRTANGEYFDQDALTAAHPTLPMPVLVRVTNLENGRSLIVRVNDRGPFVNGREIDLSRRAAELLGYDRKGTARVRVQYVGRAPLPGVPGSMGTAVASQETYIAPKPAVDESEKHAATAAPLSTVVTAGALPPPPGVQSAPVTPVSPAPVTSEASPGASMQPVADNAPTDTVPETARVQHVAVPPGTNIYVQAGSFKNFSNAEAVHQQLLAQGVHNVQVTPTVVDGAQFYRVRVGPLPDVSSADASLQSVLSKGHAGARIIVD